MTEYKIGSSIIAVTEKGKLLLFTENTRKKTVFAAARPSFEIFTEAEPQVASGSDLRLLSHSFVEGVLTVRYAMNNKSIEIEAKYQTFEDSNALKVTNIVKNLGDEPVFINYLSSSYIDNIGGDGELDWYDEDKFTVHYCHSSWQKEGQWEHASLSTLGINAGTVHASENSLARFSTVGTHSTKKYYPLVMVEDKECGAIWFTEIEGGCSWEIDVGSVGGYSGGTVFLRSSGANEQTGAWTLSLGAGESYTTRPAVIGCINGGFDEAVRTLLAYKRKDSLISFEDRDIPVVFNDYMDCLWCRRSEEKMTRLIDAAAEAGCETFCIDAGWYKNKNEGANWSETIGDWIIDDRSFGDRGLAGTLDYIRSKGMKAGVWFEWEACNPSASIYENEGAILTKHSYKINATRAFVNFRDEKTVKHLESRVDELYRMGVRYIKNDYNRCVGIGSDMYGESLGEGLVQNVAAFHRFIDRLEAKYPDLTIENCGGGALRSDSGTLRHFYLQSTSDQEFYYNNPSILCGSLAVMQPEKAGVWAYPYPVSLSDAHRDVPLDERYFESSADGEQTIFNMVNGMCGSLYLSGRIDYCDEYNKALVHEGVKTYKSIRGFIKRAYPIFPLGQLKINKRGFLALGLVGEDEILLAVWKINAKESEVEIDLSTRLSESSRAEMLYPVADKKVKFTLNSGKLKLSFPEDKQYMARMIKIKI